MPIPLVERSEREMARKIKRKLGSRDDVAECKEVTIGFTRKKPNVHSHVLIKGNPGFEETHIICSKIDRDVRSLVPNVRVVIHSESDGTIDTKEVWKTVKKTADGEPGTRGVQNIHLRKVDGGLGVDLKLQLDDMVAMPQADGIQARIDQKLKTANPQIMEVVIHRDSVNHLVFSERWGQGTELASYVDHLAKRFPELVSVAPLTSRRMADGLHLVDRVAFRPGTSGDTVLRIRSELGAALMDAYPEAVGADIVEERSTTPEM